MGGGRRRGTGEGACAGKKLGCTCAFYICCSWFLRSTSNLLLIMCHCCTPPPTPPHPCRKAAELSRTRGKLSCLLINDLDAGIGRFGNTQVGGGGGAVLAGVVGCCTWDAACEVCSSKYSSSLWDVLDRLQCWNSHAVDLLMWGHRVWGGSPPGGGG